MPSKVQTSPNVVTNVGEMEASSTKVFSESGKHFFVDGTDGVEFRTTLSDVAGRLISGNGSGILQLDMTKCSSGIHFLSIHDGAKPIFKHIVNRSVDLHLTLNFEP